MRKAVVGTGAGLLLALLLVSGIRKGERVSPGQSSGRPPIPSHGPLDPCCKVVFMDVRAGMVTARWNLTGRVVRFRLSDPALVSRFRPNQSVDVADAGSGRVTVRLEGITAITAYRVKE